MKQLFIIIFLFFIIFINSIDTPTNNENKINTQNDNQKKLEIMNNLTQTSNKKSLNNTNITKEFNLTESLIHLTKKAIKKMLNETDVENSQKSKEEKRKEEIKKDIEKIKIENIQMEKIREKYAIKREKEECERQMHNTTFSEWLPILIPGKSGEMLFQNITELGKIKFSFILSDSTKRIHLSFSGPNENERISLIKSIRNKNCLYFEYDITVLGQYTFYLNNQHYSDETEVIFSISLGVKSDKLGSKKIDKISGLLHDINNNINDMRNQQSLINRKNDAHNVSINKHNNKILIYSVAEIFVLILIFFAQTYYIKGLVNKV